MFNQPRCAVDQLLHYRLDAPALGLVTHRRVRAVQHGSTVGWAERSDAQHLDESHGLRYCFSANLQNPNIRNQPNLPRLGRLETAGSAVWALDKLTSPIGWNWIRKVMLKWWAP
jgi:hypothetical protein